MAIPKQRGADHWLAFVLFTHRYQLAEHSGDEGPRFVPVIGSAMLDPANWCHCHRGGGEATGRG